MAAAFIPCTAGALCPAHHCRRRLTQRPGAPSCMNGAGVPSTAQVASEVVAQQLRVDRGAVVQAVAPNSAAARAGLLPTRRALSGIVAGDVIVAVDRRPVAKPGARAPSWPAPSFW